MTRGNGKRRTCYAKTRTEVTVRLKVAQQAKIRFHQSRDLAQACAPALVTGALRHSRTAERRFGWPPDGLARLRSGPAACVGRKR